MSESDFTGYGTGGSAAPGTKPPPASVWQRPMDADLRIEALKRSLDYWHDDATDSDDVVNIADVFLKFLKGEPPATD